MSCDDIHDRLEDLWEASETSEVRQHLAECASCRKYHWDWRWVRSGLHLLKREEAPEPSLGFAERLVRRLGEVSKAPSVAEFFERVGRRFVYATLVITFLALLALALPSTGPVRGLSVSDIQITQEAALAYSDPMGDPGTLESPDLAPAQTPAPKVTDEVK
jgi:anti-sigma factor RsiW